MARPHVKLYVDIVSPFAYMGYYLTRVCSPVDILPVIKAFKLSHRNDITHQTD